MNGMRDRPPIRAIAAEELFGSSPRPRPDRTLIREAVLESVRRGGLTTVLRERSSGDTHGLPPIPPAGIDGIAEPAVIAALLELEKHGRLHRTEVVHAHDSAQYAVHWRAVDPGNARERVRPR